MSLFIGTLTDEDGREYEYGHCYYDDDDGNEYGCGMEYAYYADTETLDAWHDAVGLVTTYHDFTAARLAELETEHAGHETMEV